MPMPSLHPFVPYFENEEDPTRFRGRMEEFMDDKIYKMCLAQRIGMEMSAKRIIKKTKNNPKR